MISGLKGYYRRQMYLPGMVGLFVNPFYFARKNLAGAMREMAVGLGGRLLDVGCGSKPYRSLFQVESYVGLDLNTEIAVKRGVADYFYDGKTFPFADASYDCILCNQVLEHVFNPEEFLEEIHRTLVPKGKLLLTVPFVWDEHEQPYDYARYSSFGLEHLLKKSGFRLVEHRRLGADASILFQLVNAYLFKVIGVSRPENSRMRLILLLPLTACFNLFGVVVQRILPGNPELYLDHAVLAEKID